MSLEKKPKRYRHPASIISYAVWEYHRFNLSFRDVQEQLAYRGIIVSHETVRKWCLKFSRQFKEVLQKRERQVSDKWHLDEMSLRINGKSFVLWRAVDEHGMELDVFLQKRRNKTSAIRFLSRLLQRYPDLESLSPISLEVIDSQSNECVRRLIIDPIMGSIIELKMHISPRAVKKKV